MNGLGSELFQRKVGSTRRYADGRIELCNDVLTACLSAQLPGSCCVIYHEALGHGLGLPHPAIPDPFGIMSQAQYSGKFINDPAIHIEDELKMVRSLERGVRVTA